MRKTALDISAELEQLEQQVRTPRDRERVNNLMDELRAIPANAVEIIDRLVDALKENINECPQCGGEGICDSGGFTPWGSPIDIACPYCAKASIAVKFAKGEKDDS